MPWMTAMATPMRSSLPASAAGFRVRRTAFTASSASERGTQGFGAPSVQQTRPMHRLRGMIAGFLFDRRHPPPFSFGASFYERVHLHGKPSEAREPIMGAFRHTLARRAGRGRRGEESGPLQ